MTPRQAVTDGSACAFAECPDPAARAPEARTRRSNSAVVCTDQSGPSNARAPLTWATTDTLTARRTIDETRFLAVIEESRPDALMVRRMARRKYTLSVISCTSTIEQVLAGRTGRALTFPSTAAVVRKAVALGFFRLNFDLREEGFERKVV